MKYCDYVNKGMTVTFLGSLCEFAKISKHNPQVYGKWEILDSISVYRCNLMLII